MAERYPEDGGTEDIVCPLCQGRQHKKLSSWKSVREHMRLQHVGDPGLAEAAKALKKDVCWGCRKPQVNLSTHTCPKPDDLARKDKKCPLCNRAYESWKSVGAHIKQKHKEDPGAAKDLPKDVCLHCQTELVNPHQHKCKRKKHLDPPTVVGK